MNEWDGFFGAQVGASAALLGLIYVGVSINLNRIISVPRLPNRALQALLLLVVVLIISSLQLIPGNAENFFAIELMIISVSFWITMTSIDIKTYKKTEINYRKFYLFKIIVTQVSIVPYMISAFILISGDPGGMIWAAMGMIFSYLKAISESWVLLVEINR